MTTVGLTPHRIRRQHDRSNQPFKTPSPPRTCCTLPDSTEILVAHIPLSGASQFSPRQVPSQAQTTPGATPFDAGVDGDRGSIPGGGLSTWWVTVTGLTRIPARVTGKSSGRWWRMSGHHRSIPEDYTAARDRRLRRVSAATPSMPTAPRAQVDGSGTT